MQVFSARQLYIMYGGNKAYIHEDGFGDVYNATTEQEAEWTKEIIVKALASIDAEENATDINAALDNLRFHKYAGLESFLIERLENVGPVKQIIFSTTLWKVCRYEKSFDILYENLVQHKDQYLESIFISLASFRENTEAKDFLMACVEGDDDVLVGRAQMTLAMWARFK